MTSLMVSLVGPPAMISGELRPARKGAAVATDSCAGVWLAGGATQFKITKATAGTFSLLQVLLGRC